MRVPEKETAVESVEPAGPNTKDEGFTTVETSASPLCNTGIETDETPSVAWAHKVVVLVCPRLDATVAATVMVLFTGSEETSESVTQLSETQ